jgi:hypothetical protein
MGAPPLTDDCKESLRFFNAHRVECLVAPDPSLFLSDRTIVRFGDLNDLENLP